MTDLEEFRKILNDKNKVSDNLNVIIDGTELYINAGELLNIIDSLIELNKEKKECTCKCHYSNVLAYFWRETEKHCKKCKELGLNVKE